jgi:type I restriction-modification system DNA methylase subunit
MARRQQTAKDSKNDGATLGSAAELWQMADATRGGMGAAEHEHVVPGPLFLKYCCSAWPTSRRTRSAATPSSVCAGR